MGGAETSEAFVRGAEGREGAWPRVVCLAEVLLRAWEFLRLPITDH